MWGTRSQHGNFKGKCVEVITQKGERGESERDLEDGRQCLNDATQQQVGRLGQPPCPGTAIVLHWYL